MSYRFARWVLGPEADIRALSGGHGRTLVYDAKEAPLVLFDSEWTLRTTTEREKTLTFHDVAP
jgi:peptide chain release factor 3